MKVQDIDNVSVDNEWYLCNLARKELTETWILTRSVWPSLFFVTAYLLFVLQIGLRLMKNREALNLKPIILVFNLIQCVLNVYLWTAVFGEGLWKYVLDNMCHPSDNIESRLCRKECFLIWLFYVTKVTDLIHTVLFVLKKKQSHVTFLHTFHHAIMVPATRYFGLSLSGSQMTIVGGINAVVRTVMYAYYFLAALGPGVQKYLWWKIYVTRLQLIQFVCVAAYMMFLVVNQCSLSQSMSYLLIILKIIFTILFLNSYVQKKKVDNIPEKSSTQNESKSTNEKES